jgi:hypothetical protein
MMSKQRIVLTLVELPDGRAVELWLLLKTALRRHRLRLVECSVEQPDQRPRGYSPLGTMWMGSSSGAGSRGGGSKNP